MKWLKRMIFKIKKRRFCKLNHYYCPECIYHNFIWDKDGITFRGNNCLYGVPTADVVEVVRCKDCKYWNDDGLCKKHSSPIVGAIYGTEVNDYCSEGKRKDQTDERSRDI